MHFTVFSPTNIHDLLDAQLNIDAAIRLNVRY